MKATSLVDGMLHGLAELAIGEVKDEVVGETSSSLLGRVLCAREVFDIADGSFGERLNKSLVALLSYGKQADLIDAEVRRREEPEPYVYRRNRNGVFLMDTEDKVRNLLSRAFREAAPGRYSTYVDGDGNLADAVTVVREVGGTYPDEDAPSKVTVFPDGHSIATWWDEAQQPVMTVRYDAAGTPVAFRDGEKRRMSRDEVGDIAFLRPRAVLEDLKSAVIADIVDYDRRTHKAVVKDGTIVIRDMVAGKTDNTRDAAIVRADGTRIGMSQGSKLDAVPSPDLAIDGMRM